MFTYSSESRYICQSMDFWRVTVKILISQEHSHPNTYLKARFSWLHSGGWEKTISRDQKSKSMTIHLSKQLLRHIIAACTTGDKAILQYNQITGPHSCSYQDQWLQPTIWIFSIQCMYLHSREFPYCFNRMTNQRLAFII